MFTDIFFIGPAAGKESKDRPPNRNIPRENEAISLPPANGSSDAYNFFISDSFLIRFFFFRHEKHGGVVEPELLWKEFDLQAYRDSPHIPPHVKVSQIMRTWTENIGYPLITVKRNYTTGKVEITQVSTSQRFHFSSTPK